MPYSNTSPAIRRPNTKLLRLQNWRRRSSKRATTGMFSAIQHRSAHH